MSDVHTITPKDLMGDIIPHDDPNTIPLDVWRRVLDPATGKPNGYCKRDHWRTLKDVFKDLRQRLEVNVCENAECKHEWPVKSGEYNKPCPKCGYKEHYWFIDEYLHGPDICDRNPGALVPNFRWIACYPVTGGSEGHYVHVEFTSEVKEVEVCYHKEGDWERKTAKGSPQPPFEHGLVKVTRLALAKTFRGMDHAAEIARRCATLLGA